MSAVSQQKFDNIVMKVKEYTEGKHYIVVKVKSIATTPLETMKDMKCYVENLSNSRTTYIILVDLRKLNTLPIPVVMQWVEFFRSIRQFLKSSVKHTIFITPMYMLHLAINVGLKVYTPIKPFYIVSTIEEAHQNGWNDSSL